MIFNATQSNCGAGTEALGPQSFFGAKPSASIKARTSPLILPIADFTKPFGNDMATARNRSKKRSLLSLPTGAESINDYAILCQNA